MPQPHSRITLSHFKHLAPFRMDLTRSCMPHRVSSLLHPSSTWPNLIRLAPLFRFFCQFRYVLSPSNLPNILPICSTSLTHDPPSFIYQSLLGRGAEGGRRAEGKMLTLADPFRSAPPRSASTIHARGRPGGGGGGGRKGGREEGDAGVIYEHYLTPPQ